MVSPKDNISLPAGESEIAGVRTSTASKVVAWLTVPAFVLIFYVPCIHLGLVGLLVKLIPELETPLTVVFVVVLLMLSCGWIVSVRITLSSTGSGVLILTEQYIVGRQKDQYLQERVEDVQDVRLDQSLAGKLFGYGSLTIVTRGRNLTVKNVGKPEPFRKQLLNAANVHYYN